MPSPEIASPATVLMVLGSVTALASLPLHFDLVRPNRWYGIRVPAAFHSEQNWYAINRFGAARFIRFGVVVAFAGLVLNHYPAAPFWVPLLCLVGTLPLLLLTVRSINRYARSL
jgi:hypothetical protein